MDSACLPTPYYRDELVTLYCGDSAALLPALGRHDLLLTDPPYGIGAYKRGTMGGGVLAKQSTYAAVEWDGAPPIGLVADAIAQSSRAIVWGGNYFGLPPSSCWLVWDKQTGKNNFADCELAWTNLPGSVRLIQHRWCGFIRKGREARHHPTQKPLDVMTWCIQKAAKKRPVLGILDPFAGAGTTGVASKRLCIPCVLIERDASYCSIIAARLAAEPMPSPVAREVTA